MWSSPQKIFSVTLPLKKWVSRQSPRDTRPILLIITKKSGGIVPQKIFLRDARLSKKWVSTVALRHSPLLKLIITKNQISMWRPLKKNFLRDARLSKVGLDSRPVTLASIQVDNHEKN